MAGLGFGGLAGARLSRVTKSPLRLYAAVELGVALLALLLPLAFAPIGDAYANAYSALTPATLALLRFGMAFLVITPVTFLMGTTLPLMTRYFVREVSGAGPAIGLLYAANTLGATIGTLLSGFVLIEVLGLAQTSHVAVALNATAGLVALWLSRRERAGRAAGHPAAFDDEKSQPAAAPSPQGRAVPRPLLFVATFTSGFVALALEVLWTREIAERTGSMIYLFVAILALFLVGITVGSRQYQFRSRPDRDTVATLGLLFAATGIVAVVSMAIGSIASDGPAQAARTVLLMLAVVVATGFMGYSFPLTGRLAMRSASEAGATIGTVYAANTAGGILGAFAGTFLLAGTLGTPGSILLVGLAEMLIGVALVAAGGRNGSPLAFRARVLGAAALSLIVIAADPALARTSTQNLVAGSNVVKTHAEDEIATVDAVGGAQTDRKLYVAGVGMTSLTVDTKLMAYLPKAARPQAKTLLAVCFGMGSTFRSSLILGLKTDAVDLSPSVPRQMRVFFPDASTYLGDSRGRVVAGDGRNFVRVGTARYDIIVVDPPPPVESAGTVVLYTREFMDQSKARLNPGGMMMLFMQNAVTIDGFKMHLRTFAASFRHVSVVFTPGTHGTYFFGSDQPVDFSPAALKRVLSSPQAVADLSESPDQIGGDSSSWPEALGQKVWLTDGQVGEFVGQGPVITDDRPRSEYFLLYRLANPDLTPVSEDSLRAAYPRGAG
jgi:spermidine synthase